MCKWYKQIIRLAGSSLLIPEVEGYCYNTDSTDYDDNSDSYEIGLHVYFAISQQVLL